METKLKQALQTILDLPSKGLIAYAQSYADACLTLGGNPKGKVVEGDPIFSNVLQKEVPVIKVEMEKTGVEMEGDEMKTQILYILANLSGWRGDEARETKQVLKSYAK